MITVIMENQPLCLVVHSDHECEKILLSIGLLGLTKPKPPHTLTITPVRFRREQVTWIGFSLHHAHHANPCDNGYQIVAVDAPLDATKREFLNSLLPHTQGPVRPVTLPDYPEN